MGDLINKFQKWLKTINEHQPSETLANKQINDQNSVSVSENPTDNSVKNIQRFSKDDLMNHNKIKIFENDALIVFIEKTIHQRLKKFQFLDNLFQIKILTKNDKPPFLKDLLQTFDELFKFIIDHVKTFFNKEDHNAAYLTLCQDPMVNGINTGNSLRNTSEHFFKLLQITYFDNMFI